MDKININNENQVIPYETYEGFLKYAKIPMIIIEEDATITLCNKACERLTGYPKREIEGSTWERFIADESDLKIIKKSL